MISCSQGRGHTPPSLLHPSMTLSDLRQVLRSSGPSRDAQQRGTCSLMASSPHLIGIYPPCAEGGRGDWDQLGLPEFQGEEGINRSVCP